MKYGENGRASPNYQPNSFDDIVQEKKYRIPPQMIADNIIDYYDRNAGMRHDDYFTQPGVLFRDVMDEGQKQRLVEVIAFTMNQIKTDRRQEIIES